MSSAPSPDEAISRPMTFVGAALWTAAALVVGSFVLSVLESARAGSIYDIVSVTGATLLAYAVVLLGILLVHEPAAPISRVLGLRRAPVHAVLLAVVIGAALALPSGWLDQVLDARFPPPPDDVADRLYDVTTLVQKIEFVVTVVLAGSVCEELFFRGALFGPLSRGRRLATVVFGVAAIETLFTTTLGSGPRTPVVTVVLSSSLVVTFLAFSCMRAMTGSVLPSIFARIAWTAVSAVPTVLGRPLPRPTKAWVLATVFAALFGVVAFFLSTRRDARRRDEPIVSS